MDKLFRYNALTVDAEYGLGLKIDKTVNPVHFEKNPLTIEEGSFIKIVTHQGDHLSYNWHPFRLLHATNFQVTHTTHDTIFIDYPVAPQSWNAQRFIDTSIYDDIWAEGQLNIRRFPFETNGTNTRDGQAMTSADVQDYIYQHFLDQAPERDHDDSRGTEKGSGSAGLAGSTQKVILIAAMILLPMLIWIFN